ncbi:MAG TPA: ABC transporter ATP-binding protein [Acidimicrobiales bacterium]|nr:ABC transporter ATP-binding protein [Acidimicrobiales bacterium]
MSSEVAVAVRRLGLAYRRTRYPSGRLRRERHWALWEVSLRAHRGEVVGVVGHNGAGKSTLLRVISGALPPTRGSVHARGRVAALADLGAGFESEYQAPENVVLYGTMLGIDPGYLRRRAPAIIEWAGLTEVADVPLREYSSGMLARLAFAVAADEDPDVLLIDDALAVGDEAFQERSWARAKELVEGGAAVILVSHASETVGSLAQRVVWMQEGAVVASGHPASVLAAYRDRESHMMRGLR